MIRRPGAQFCPDGQRRTDSDDTISRGDAELCWAWAGDAPRPKTIKTNKKVTGGQECPPQQELDIQVLYVERVVFYEFSAGFHVFAHQGGEDGFALGYVFEADLQERAALGIHGRLPELLGGHFSEAFVALHHVLFAAFV